MNFINLKFLLLLIFFLNGVNSLTEEEITSILYKFEKKIHEQLSEATRDIPDIKKAIQGTKVISGILSKHVHDHGLRTPKESFFSNISNFWAWADILG